MSQAVPVLRDGPPRHLDSLVLEQLRELAVGQGLAGILGRDQLADQGPDRRGRTGPA
jgi:hypothetical protein